MCPFDADGVTYIYIVSILCSSVIAASGGSTESGLEKGFITPQIIVYGLISNLLHVLYPRFGCASRPSPPANTWHWTNVGSMLGRRRGRRASIDPTLVQCLVLAEDPRSTRKWRMCAFYDVRYSRCKLSCIIIRVIKPDKPLSICASKAKRQYLLTCKVSRYRLLALQSALPAERCHKAGPTLTNVGPAFRHRWRNPGLPWKRNI